MTSVIITAETHPDHHTVGHYFGGYLDSARGTVIYYCDSYDPAQGYWLTQVDDVANRRNVAEHAIGRTFHEARDGGSHWNVSQWNVSVPKCVSSEGVTGPGMFDAEARAIAPLTQG